MRQDEFTQQDQRTAETAARHQQPNGDTGLRVGDNDAPAGRTPPTQRTGQAEPAGTGPESTHRGERRPMPAQHTGQPEPNRGTANPATTGADQTNRTQQNRPAADQPDRTRNAENSAETAQQADRTRPGSDTGSGDRTRSTERPGQTQHPDRHTEHTDRQAQHTDRPAGHTDRTAGDGGHPEQLRHTDRPAEHTADGGDELVELFSREAVRRFREEWQRVQTRFVDDPRDAVQSADHLVTEVIRALGVHKHELEGRWRDGSDVQTEDLRQTLRHYRSFFNQLMKVS